jgi:hypothetical protein
VAEMYAFEILFYSTIKTSDYNMLEARCEAHFDHEIVDDSHI